MKDEKRYHINHGSYGAYFYDTKYNTSMTLKEVLKILNVYEEIRVI